MHLKYGYTNRLEIVGGYIRKTYVGRGASIRRTVELACLRGLRGHLPVPEVVLGAADEILLLPLPGENGRSLIESGKADAVLHASGRQLRKLHLLPASLIPRLPGSGPALVHGDFAVHNLLFESDGNSVTAIVDWERAHFGESEEDVAWFEWVIRTYHAKEAVRSMGRFFDGYGTRSRWALRRKLIVELCERMRWGDPIDRERPAEILWKERAKLAATWLPLHDD